MTSTTSAAARADAEDPYLWLEELDGPRAVEWVRAENQKTLAALEKDSHFDPIYRDALEIAEARDRLPSPSIIGGQVFNFWQDAEHVRGIWRRTTALDYATPSPAWTTVLDLDALATQENANWVWQGATCLPPHQRLCMVHLSDGGEDAVTIREFDRVAGRFVLDGFFLPRGKQSVAWEGEDSLLVAREWTPGEVTASGYPFVVKRWKRHQPLNDAQEIFRGTPSDVGVNPFVWVDASGHRAALIQRDVSFFESQTYLVTDAGVAKLGLPAKAQVIGLLDGQLLVSVRQDWTVGQVTFQQGSLVAVHLQAATRNPQDLRPVLVYEPGPRESLESAATTRDALIVNYLDNVRGRASLHRPDGRGQWSRHALMLPDHSSVSIVSSDTLGAQAFLSVTGFLRPTSLWSLDTRVGTVDEIKLSPARFDASALQVVQFEATSSDGTQIPYFMVGPKDHKLDGSLPTVINAYGGFEISKTPAYNGLLGKRWLTQGGVFVVANIRGGGEFGPAWHDAGLKTRRQIIFDDFTAVARDLITRGITSPRHLGIQGGSNGGLLMGVQFTQHPELWNAVDIQIPLLDMLRYETIAAGPSWVGEYGSVSNPDERDFLASISPYSNLKQGVRYPQPLVWTTTKDDRVGPQHARKFAARLAEYGHPYYFYEATEGGHGAGANLKESARTTALEWTYFTRKLMAR